MMQIDRRRMKRAITITLCVLVMAFMLLWFVKAISDAFYKDYGPQLADTVGEIRYNKLDQLTTEYMSENPKGEILVVNGERLAPLQYLNSELRALDASWRVEIVDDQIRFQEIA